MATDYVLRVLYERLSRSLYALAEQVANSSSNTAGLSYFSTVSDMLAADVSTISDLLRCANYESTDGIASLWVRVDGLTDNGTDIRQSTFNTSVSFERVWVKEF